MGAIILLALGIALYFVPSFVASANGHRQTLAIVVLNVLLGWTLVGWVIALVWAFTAERPAPVVQIAQAPPGPPVSGHTHKDDAADIERFAKLRDDGLITQEEFDAKKRAILQGAPKAP